MKHIRIPVTTGHMEAGWFGYLYLWQCQSNGAVGTRLQMNDPREFPSKGMTWEEPMGVEAVGYDNIIPLEVDALDILNDHYPHLKRCGTHQTKMGRQWVGAV